MCVCGSSLAKIRGAFLIVKFDVVIGIGFDIVIDIYLSFCFM